MHGVGGRSMSWRLVVNRVVTVTSRFASVMHKFLSATHVTKPANVVKHTVCPSLICLFTLCDSLPTRNTAIADKPERRIYRSVKVNNRSVFLLPIKLFLTLVNLLICTSSTLCYSLLICCYPFLTAYIFFFKHKQSLISLRIISYLESKCCLVTTSYHKSPCWWCHTVIHLPPAHHCHPPSHIHCFIPRSYSSFPQIFASIAKFCSFQSQCMTEGKWPCGPALLGWGDLRHSSVWRFSGVELGELQVCGWMLSEVDWLLLSWAKPGPRQKLWGRTEAVRSKPCEDEASPSQLKTLPRGRLDPRQMPQGLYPWLQLHWVSFGTCSMLKNVVTLKFESKVTQCYCKWYHWVEYA